MDSVNSKSFLILLVSVGVFALVLAWPVLNYPWFYDDYHLIRLFSPAELFQVFTGSCDLEGFETSSYRPLFVLTSHIRMLMFGEHMLPHHLFQVFALVFFTCLMGFSFLSLGLELPYVIGASILAISTKSNFVNLVWLTDATHALSGIPVACCCVIVSRCISLTFLNQSVIFMLALMGLLVREDIAALFPAVVMMAFFRCMKTLSLPAVLDDRKHFFLMMKKCIFSCLPTLLPLFFSLIVYFSARHYFVPNAIGGFLWLGLLRHITMTFFVMGLSGAVVVPILWVGFWVLLMGMAFCLRSDPKNTRIELLLWLICVVLGCIPGLVLARSNLLMVPATLFAFFLVMALRRVIDAYRSQVVRAILLVSMTAFVSVSFYETRQAFLTAHAQSIENLMYTYYYIYGQYAGLAKIPAERRAKAEESLRRYGITSEKNFHEIFEQLDVEAERNGNTPPADGGVFRASRVFFVF